MWSVTILRALGRQRPDLDSYFATYELQYEISTYQVFCEGNAYEIEEHTSGEEEKL